MSRSIAISVAVLLAAFSEASPTNASTMGDPTGVWLTQAGDAKVAVSRCGETICGRIVWLKAPIDPTTGKPQVDDKNPNPSLAKRPIIGLPLFVDMKPQGQGKWSGRIYNADDGKLYASNVSLREPAKLSVEGCVGVLCGGEIWTK
jgi:uncharacterized protein (DUF2147 family)